MGVLCRQWEVGLWVIELVCVVSIITDINEGGNEMGGKKPPQRQPTWAVW